MAKNELKLATMNDPTARLNVRVEVLGMGVTDKMVSKGLHKHVMIMIIFPYLEVYSHSRLVSYLSYAFKKKYNPVSLISYLDPPCQQTFSLNEISLDLVDSKFQVILRTFKQF